MTFNIPKFKHRSQGKKKLTGIDTLATKKKYKQSKEEEKVRILKVSIRELIEKKDD